ncbi:MAG: hypothetical protein AAFX03_00600 [Pseudomonadota bacterium]
MTDVPMVLQRIGAKLTGEVAPALEGHYLAGTAGMIGALAAMGGQAMEVAADNLMTEIGGMARLLEAGGRDPGDTNPASLKLTDLRALRDRLAADLIELQAEIEVSEEPEAKALNARIWNFFLGGAAARLPELPGGSTETE